MKMAVLNVIIKDRKTGAPIPYVRVQLNSIASSADSQGKATFDVPPGEYTLSVRSPAHRPYTSKVKAPGTYTVYLEYALF